MKNTILFSLILLKPDPVIVIVVPTAAVVGENDIKAKGNATNSFEVEAIVPSRSTVIVPVVTPDGTTADKEVAEIGVVVAATLLNFTI